MHESKDEPPGGDVLWFPNLKEMARKSKAIAIQQTDVEQSGQAERRVQQYDKTPERKSIVLPRGIWRLIEREAENDLRSLNKQIEAVMINYYQLGARRIESLIKVEPCSDDVEALNNKAS
jgi:hypothetical protein